jgi:hypothetical protein
LIGTLVVPIGQAQPELQQFYCIVNNMVGFVAHFPGIKYKVMALITSILLHYYMPNK